MLKRILKTVRNSHHRTLRENNSAVHPCDGLSHVEEGKWLISRIAKKRIRKDFGTLPSVMEVPQLLAIQLDSYHQFLTGNSVESDA